MKSFKEIIFSKKVDKLNDWIAENKAKDIDEINHFIYGIERNIDVVKM